jgi:hypothetical protein
VLLLAGDGAMVSGASLRASEPCVSASVLARCKSTYPTMVELPWTLWLFHPLNVSRPQRVRPHGCAAGSLGSHQAVSFAPPRQHQRNASPEIETTGPTRLGSR